MFRRRRKNSAPIKRAAPAPAPPPALPPLPTLFLTLVDDRGSFFGAKDRQVLIDGFDLELVSGRPVFRNEDGPVAERVFYFRVAGVAHHEAAAQSDSFQPLAPLLLVREPTNQADPNAIRVMSEDGRSTAGFVPASLAGQMASLLDSIGGRATQGAVTKTFTARGRRNAIEVIAAIERTIDMSGTVADE